MKTQFGAIIVAGSGKLGGHVASKNKGGAYMRTRVTPVNPQSVAQSTVRNRFTGISQAWRGLTEAQRNAWNGAVGAFARSDVFGNLRNPSGFALYQRLNNNLLAVGSAVLTLPPALTDLDVISDLVLTYASAVPALSLAFTATAGGDSGFKVFATPPVSQGVSFVKPEYRLIDADAVIAVSPMNILANYTTVFGGVGEVGTKIFVKIVPVGGATGLEGIALSTSKVAAA